MEEQWIVRKRAVVTSTLVALCIAVGATGCNDASQRSSSPGVAGTLPDRPVVDAPANPPVQPPDQVPVNPPAQPPDQVPVNPPARVNAPGRVPANNPSSSDRLGQGGDDLPSKPDGSIDRQGAGGRLAQESGSELLPGQRFNGNPPPRGKTEGKSCADKTHTDKKEGKSCKDETHTDKK